ncbi:MAG: integrase core domain-containing protein [Phycisphaerales bacterium]|nr:integrase core domain-containing protein [Phycisphaerales bacterium]
MSRWVYVVLHLLFEGQAARRDARVRFLLAQVDILRSKLDGNRVIPSPADRSRLLAIGKELGHDVKDIVGIVKPETYRRWIREGETGTEPKAVGRPRISTVRRRIIVRFARENLGWGYRRIVGELSKLHLPVGRSSIRRILREEGFAPPPGNARRTNATETPWRKFLRLHMNTLVACDFFTKSVWTPFGTRTAYGLFFIHLKSRRVFMCSATYHPNRQWMMQQARNVQMWMEDENIEARFLLRDRDAKFSLAFDALFNNAGIRIVKAPVQAPNANAFAESWIGSLKRECLDHFVCFSRGHLDHILREYVRFHNQHRPHQGLGNRTLRAALGNDPPPDHPESSPIHCQRFLGGLLRHYYRAA